MLGFQCAALPRPCYFLHAFHFYYTFQVFSKKAAPEALLSLLEEQDEELTTEIVSALTVCIQSSLKAERLDEKVEDFASQEDMLGLLRPNIVKLLMKHGGDAGFALLKDVASEDSHKGLQAPQLLREEVGRLMFMISNRQATPHHFEILTSVLSSEGTGTRHQMKELVEEHGGIEEDLVQWCTNLLATIADEESFDTQKDILMLVMTLNGSSKRSTMLQDVDGEFWHAISLL